MPGFAMVVSPGRGKFWTVTKVSTLVVPDTTTVALLSLMVPQNTGEYWVSWGGGVAAADVVEPRRRVQWCWVDGCSGAGLMGAVVLGRRAEVWVVLGCRWLAGWPAGGVNVPNSTS